jgi:hypothetical protein
MTDNDNSETQGHDQGEPPDSGALRTLLKQSLSTPEPPAHVLPEVQRKLRERSRNKFYATTWSQSPPSKLAITLAILLLIAAAIVTWALSPSL